MNKFLHFVLCACLGLLAAQAGAVPPQTVNYQGYLTNPGGTPINGAVGMTFRLYDTAAGGAALYTELQSGVVVSNGTFNAVIGSTTPIALPFDVPYWLTVAVNADAEMAPRQPLASSPYAFRASTLLSTATVTGAQLVGTINNASLPASNLTGFIKTALIDDNAVTQQKLSPMSGAAAGKVLGTDGTNLQWQAASSGSVTSVGTGDGLNGGPITTTGTIGLTSTNLLPTTACAANQIPKWSGVAWVCAGDANAGGTVTSVATGAGLTGGPVTTSGTISLAATNQLPTIPCSTDQIIKWNGSAWVCAASLPTIYTGTIIVGQPVVTPTPNDRSTWQVMGVVTPPAGNYFVIARVNGQTESNASVPGVPGNLSGIACELLLEPTVPRPRIDFIEFTAPFGLGGSIQKLAMTSYVAVPPGGSISLRCRTYGTLPIPASTLIGNGSHIDAIPVGGQING